GVMEFAAEATTIGLAALAGAFRQGAAKQPTIGSQASDLGAEVALGEREFCAMERGTHVLYPCTIQEQQAEYQYKIQCEFALLIRKGQNVNRISWFLRLQIPGCGIAGPRPSSVTLGGRTNRTIYSWHS